MDCPECQYSTQKPKQMQRHQEQTKHGRHKRASRVGIVTLGRGAKKSAGK